MNIPTPKTILLPDDGMFPNHPRWPLLVYPGVLKREPGLAAAAFERLFQDNGWGGLWRNGIFSFPHFHSNAHEALGIFRGAVRVRFGGPQGVECQLQAGDVAVLPAGTVHENLGASLELGLVGAYPPGMENYDLCRGHPEESSSVLENIQRAARPLTDPVCGTAGGLCELWPT